MAPRVKKPRTSAKRHYTDRRNGLVHRGKIKRMIAAQGNRCPASARAAAFGSFGAAPPDEAGVPTLVEAREIIAEFHLMLRRKTEEGLIPWIERARASLVASFASGVAKDEAAVRATITSLWSNGQTEGQITRLKLVKRQTYGRGKIDLLKPD